MRLKNKKMLLSRTKLSSSYSFFYKKNIIISVTLIIVLFASIFLIINRYRLISGVKTSQSTAETTSKEPSAQSNFNDGKERDALQTNKNEGTITDSNGVITIIPPKASWLTSQDGVISVYYPQKDSILATGQSLSGETSANMVSFRLIDNVSGVIAQGDINVVNKKFSGVFNFSTSANEGRVDIFITNENGVESSTVVIPIRFK